MLVVTVYLILPRHIKATIRALKLSNSHGVYDWLIYSINVVVWSHGLVPLSSWCCSGKKNSASDGFVTVALPRLQHPHPEGPRGVWLRGSIALVCNWVTASSQQIPWSRRLIWAAASPLSSPPSISTCLLHFSCGVSPLLQCRRLGRRVRPCCDSTVAL